VQLLHPHAKSLPQHQRHLGQQRATVGVEQPIQCPADAVVAEALRLRGIDAEQAPGETAGGLLLAVDRFALHDDRAQQRAQCLRVRHRAAAVGGGHMALEQLEQPQALQEVVDQG
jgi:hypothetical protein